MTPLKKSFARSLALATLLAPGLLAQSAIRITPITPSGGNIQIPTQSNPPGFNVGIPGQTATVRTQGSKGLSKESVEQAVKALRDIKGADGKSAFDGLSTTEKRRAVAMYLTSDSQGNSDSKAMNQVLGALNNSGMQFNGNRVSTSSNLNISAANLGSGTTSQTQGGRIAAILDTYTFSSSLSNDTVNITVRNVPDIAKNIIQDVGGSASLF